MKSSQNSQDDHKTVCIAHSLQCACSLRQCLKDGWKDVQEDCRPDVSFRAMVVIMNKWLDHMEGKSNEW